MHWKSISITTGICQMYVTMDIDILTLRKGCRPSFFLRSLSRSVNHVRIRPGKYDLLASLAKNLAFTQGGAKHTGIGRFCQTISSSSFCHGGISTRGPGVRGGISSDFESSFTRSHDVGILRRDVAVSRDDRERLEL